MITSDGLLPVTVETESTGPVAVEVDQPRSLSGNLRVSMVDAQAQISAGYGILTTDVVVNSATGGSGTAANGLFRVRTGTSPGGYGAIRSVQICRSLASFPCRFQFTAIFSPPVALSQQLAGAFNANDGLFIGYTNTTFGVMRRIAGSTSIQRLTITNGAGGVETLTITLNGVAFVVATPGALSTTGLAEFIAEQTATAYTGWSGFAPQSVGATVTLFQDVPFATAGAFTFASTGTAAGTFATVQAGAANDSTTGFVAQADWNIDTLDGTGPSGFTLDHTKLNAFEIDAYFGVGPLVFKVMLSDGTWYPFHRFVHSNLFTAPSQRLPSLRVGWAVVSFGSTTDISVWGSDAAAYREAIHVPARVPNSRRAAVTAGTTEFVALALRVSGEFASTVNLRLVAPASIGANNDSANRSLSVLMRINPTMAGTVNWAAHNAATSCMHYATPSMITPVGGSVFELELGGDQGAGRDISTLQIRLQPGDVLAISPITTSGTASCTVSCTWSET